jgi:hypothetical protein
MSNMHEHLEHAEHAEHHASDPFNQRVAVSMAILAAILAGISMVGHRTHNKVLQLQGDANRIRTEAATAEVEKSNLFAWYQSKRLRQSQLESTADIVELLAPTTADAQAIEARKKKIADWNKKARSYNESSPEKDNLPDLREQGAAAGKRAAALQEKAKSVRDEADHVHHQADRLDIGHLLAEIGLVLCSIALLTKKKAYWIGGLLAAVAAIGITISAYMIPHDHDHAEPHEAASAAAKQGTQQDDSKQPTPAKKDAH